MHGEAVSAGMLMAFEYSHAQGLCSESDVKRLAKHLNKIALIAPRDLEHLLKEPKKLYAHMGQDKKNEGGALTLILARTIGDAFVQKNASGSSVLLYLTGLSEKAHHA